VELSAPLGRQPESAEVVQRHARAYRPVAEIWRVFMQSEEFGQRVADVGARVPDSEILRHFPSWTGAGEPGFWCDFLGVRTRCDYVPEAYGVLPSTVEGPPGTEKMEIHEVGTGSAPYARCLESENATYSSSSSS
jgi:hypothetical protein